MTLIYVDADACPVKDEVVRVAQRHGLDVAMVSNSWMRTDPDPRIRLVVVEQGPDVADDWIAERAGRGDIVITNDIPLAARCLEAGATVLGSQGREFTEAGIGSALAMRELNAHLRETGESAGYNAAFTKKDRLRFLDAMERSVQKALRLT
jgi:uncharacterized protein YaiI (UPF0178 family)